MKIAFKNIAQQLEDPFFELSTIGKNALKADIISIEKFGIEPTQLQFVSWNEEDNKAEINYNVEDTSIGRLLIATTDKGVCFLGFLDTEKDAEKDLFNRFPGHSMKKGKNDFFKKAIAFCNGETEGLLLLHVKGTAFQLSIWKKLVYIPEGRVTAYADLCESPKAARAVGTAVGDNPVSYIIPCHRVIRGDGSFYGYYWGNDLKRKLLAYELQK